MAEGAEELLGKTSFIGSFVFFIHTHRICHGIPSIVRASSLPFFTLSLVLWLKQDIYLLPFRLGQTNRTTNNRKKANIESGKERRRKEKEGKSWRMAAIPLSPLSRPDITYYSHPVEQQARLKRRQSFYLLTTSPWTTASSSYSFSTHSKQTHTAAKSILHRGNWDYRRQQQQQHINLFFFFCKGRERWRIKGWGVS